MAVETVRGRITRLDAYLRIMNAFDFYPGSNPSFNRQDKVVYKLQDGCNIQAECSDGRVGVEISGKGNMKVSFCLEESGLKELRLGSTKFGQEQIIDSSLEPVLADWLQATLLESKMMPIKDFQMWELHGHDFFDGDDFVIGGGPFLSRAAAERVGKRELEEMRARQPRLFSNGQIPKQYQIFVQGPDGSVSEITLSEDCP